MRAARRVVHDLIPGEGVSGRRGYALTVPADFAVMCASSAVCQLVILVRMAPAWFVKDAAIVSVVRVCAPLSVARVDAAARVSRKARPCLERTTAHSPQRWMGANRTVGRKFMKCECVA